MCCLLITLCAVGCVILTAWMLLHFFFKGLERM